MVIAPFQGLQFHDLDPTTDFQTIRFCDYPPLPPTGSAGPLALNGLAETSVAGFVSVGVSPRPAGIVGDFVANLLRLACS